MTRRTRQPGQTCPGESFARVPTTTCAPFGADLSELSCYVGVVATPGSSRHAVQDRQKAPPLRLRETAAACGVFGHGLAHDEALRLAEPFGRRPQRPHGRVVDAERHLGHTDAIIPYSPILRSLRDRLKLEPALERRVHLAPHGLD